MRFQRAVSQEYYKSINPLTTSAKYTLVRAFPWMHLSTWLWSETWEYGSNWFRWLDPWCREMAKAAKSLNWWHFVFCVRAFVLCLKALFISFFWRIRFKKLEERNYTFVLRFELIFTIIPSVPFSKGLLTTQLFVNSHSPRHQMHLLCSRALDVECSHRLWMDHMVVLPRDRVGS